MLSIDLRDKLSSLGHPDLVRSCLSNRLKRGHQQIYSLPYFETSAREKVNEPFAEMGRKLKSILESLKDGVLEDED